MDGLRKALIRMARGDDIGEKAAPSADLRFVAQLNMLHSMATTLARLDDVAEIADAITEELRTILDYHNCRVYVMQEDGLDAAAHRVPRRDLLRVRARDPGGAHHPRRRGHHRLGGRASHLVAHAGRETGRVRRSRSADTDDILESMLAVPMTVGDVVQGVIVLSSLGYGAFDEEDQRLLEVLASHAAIAISNAKLLQAEREAAETSTALLGLSKQLTQLRIGRRHPPGCDRDRLVADRRGGGRVPRARRAHGRFPARSAPHRRRLGATRPRPRDRRRPESVAVVRRLRERRAAGPPPASPLASDPHYRLSKEPREMLVAPMRWEPDGAGTIAVVGRRGDGVFGDRELRLIRGVADLTSLALGNARRMSELERFHELVAGLDAAFWEASIPDLEFTFVAGADAGPARRRHGGVAGAKPGPGARTSMRATARRRWRDCSGPSRAGVGEGLEYRVHERPGAPRSGSETWST